MKENKYYTPTIEEFYVGFEFEMKSRETSNGFLKQTFTKHHDLGNISLILQDKFAERSDSPSLFEIRVKCLDEEDILELGFSKIERKPFREDMESNWRFYEHKHTSDTFISFLPNEYLIIHGIAENLFKGTIKNKSELKKIQQKINFPNLEL